MLLSIGLYMDANLRNFAEYARIIVNFHGYLRDFNLLPFTWIKGIFMDIMDLLELTGLTTLFFCRLFHGLLHDL